MARLLDALVELMANSYFEGGFLPQHLKIGISRIIKKEYNSLFIVYNLEDCYSQTP